MRSKAHTTVFPLRVFGATLDLGVQPVALARRGHPLREVVTGRFVTFCNAEVIDVTG